MCIHFKPSCSTGLSAPDRRRRHPPSCCANCCASSSSNLLITGNTYRKPQVHGKKRTNVLKSTINIIPLIKEDYLMEDSTLRILPSLMLPNLKKYQLG